MPEIERTQKGQGIVESHASASEQHRVLVEFNDTACDAPTETCIHHMIEERAACAPDRPAVMFADRELTYGELNVRANQLARWLHSHGVGPNVFVGIHTEPTLEMLVALLGVLKAGGAYVPLDPEYPADRLAFMIEDTRAQILLEQPGLPPIRTAGDVTVLPLDGRWDCLAGESEENPERVSEPDDIAYAIYTSGSTGMPKGVLVNHANLVHSTHARVLYYGGRVGRYLLLSSFGFDSSVAGIFWTLIDGGALVLPQAGTQRDPRLINELMARRRVTHSLCLASHYALIMSEGQPEAFATLEVAIVSGEVFSTALVARHDALAPGAHLFNEYGPTEGSVWSSVFNCHDPLIGNKVPMGKPIANTQFYIVDQGFEPMPIGEPGELYQGGAGVAVGYLDRPDLTAEKFVPDPFSDRPGARLYRSGDLARWLPDGNIEFLGRIDHQVKLRGYRIELGEIEAVLGKHPSIREVAVLCREDEPGDKRLVAYVACHANAAPPMRIWRDHLAEKLPEHMIPAVYVVLEALPRTSIGKLDVVALPQPSRARADLDEEFVPPRDPVEKATANIWAAALDVDAVGVHDDFFVLGGNSIMAARIVMQLREAFGVELPLRAIFDNRTVAGLAAVLTEQGAGAPVPATVRNP